MSVRACVAFTLKKGYQVLWSSANSEYRSDFVQNQVAFATLTNYSSSRQVHQILPQVSRTPKAQYVLSSTHPTLSFHHPPSLILTHLLVTTVVVRLLNRTDLMNNRALLELQLACPSHHSTGPLQYASCWAGVCVCVCWLLDECSEPALVEHSIVRCWAVW